MTVAARRFLLRGLPDLGTVSPNQVHMPVP